MANLPHVFGTLTVPPFPPLSYFDDNFNALNTAPSVSVVITGSPFNADPTGNTDSTAAIQAAINSLSATGGTVVIPPGTFLVSGTLNMTFGKIMVVGTGRRSAQLKFANGNAHGIVIGGQANSILGITITDVFLNGSGKTGGDMVHASVLGEMVIQRCDIANAWNGIYLEQTNSVTIRDCLINATVVGGLYGLKWFSPSNNTQRSDVLTLDSVTIQCNGAGQDGIIWDGMCQTMRIFGVGILNCRYGFHVQNTAANATFWPAFLLAFDLEVDGTSLTSLQIDAGREFHFLGCDFFNSAAGNTDSCQILADGAASITSALWFVGCRFGGANHRGMYCEAQNVFIDGTYIGDCSVSGVGSYPALELGGSGAPGTAAGIVINGGALGNVFGDTVSASYGLLVDAGVVQVTVNGVDFTNCHTGSINDSSGGIGNVRWSGCIDFNGNQLADRVAIVAADPSALVEGQIWENLTSHALKVYLNGAIKTVTVT